MEQTESIRKLIENIDNDNIALPEFQRDFVWDISKTLDLFDSIIRDIFIGAIIYGKPSFEIAVRELDKRPRKGKESREKLKITSLNIEEIKRKTEIDNYRIILDGQQRVTSIYRALKGIDFIWFIVKNDADYGDDELREKSYSEQTLEDILYEISNEEDSERLSICLSDIYLMMENSWRESKIKTKFFDKQIDKFDEVNEEANFEIYLNVSDKLQDIFKESKLLNYYLLNMKEDKFALFFERSNSKGINLKFTDILAAKLYAGNFNLRDKIEEFENNNPDIKDIFNQEVIVRTIAYLANRGKDKIDKAYILKKLTNEHFNQYWDEVCCLYKRAFNFLHENHYVISQKWMPYEPMLIPLMIFLRELNHDYSQMTEIHKEFIQYWYWGSVFSQRYTGASNETIIKDANYLRLIAKNQKILDKAYFNRLSRLQINNKDDFYDYKRKASAIYKGTLNLIHFASDGLIGWENGNRLHVEDNKLEDHHIYPVNFIKKKFKDNQFAIDKMESVVNRTLIPKITNIKVADKPPSEYMGEIKERNKNIEKSLENHLIPLEVLDTGMDELFENILDIRAEKLFNVLQTLLINKQEAILARHYKKPENIKKDRIKVQASYYNKIIEAVFELELQKVIYKGEALTPSGAAARAKAEIRGKPQSNTNGWIFWKYQDESGEWRTIKDFRQ